MLCERNKSRGTVFKRCHIFKTGIDENVSCGTKSVSEGLYIMCIGADRNNFTTQFTVTLKNGYCRYEISYTIDNPRVFNSMPCPLAIIFLRIISVIS